MAYEVVMSYHLHMPSYFLGTFTEYPQIMPPETVGNITLISTTEYYSVSGFSAPISSLAKCLRWHEW